MCASDSDAFSSRAKRGGFSRHCRKAAATTARAAVSVKGRRSARLKKRKRDYISPLERLNDIVAAAKIDLIAATIVNAINRKLAYFRSKSSHATMPLRAS
jgi:hypothetical protein